MRLLICGDWHGDYYCAEKSIQAAVDNGCDKIVQLGDFGWWPRLKRRPLGEFPIAIEEDLRSTGIDLYFLDGNHEDFGDLLTRGHRVDSDGFWKFYAHDMEGNSDDLRHIREFSRVHYIPRGLVWEWERIKFMGFGGAPSVDKHRRTVGLDWFPEEMPSNAEINNALDNAQQVDIMFTHDSPILPPAFQGLKLDFKIDALSAYSRKTVAALVDAYDPISLYHGHYHFRYDGVYVDERDRETEIIGLNCHGNEDSWTVVDLKDPWDPDVDRWDDESL